MRRLLARSCLLLTLPLTAGASYARAQAALAENRFDAAIARIHDRFWQEIPREELEARALRALVRELDPYGRVLDAADWSSFRDEISASFAGVGVVLELDADAGLPRIQGLIVGSAAGAAGARRGDRIEAIDAHPLAGLPLDDAFPRLRGEPGTHVRLRLSQPGGPKREIDVVRKAHHMPSVHGVARDEDGDASYLLEPRNGIGYLRIEHLAKDSCASVAGALARLASAGATGLVLDLRGSYGGLKSAAVQIADLFLAEGLLAGSEGRHDSTREIADPAVAWAGPLLVLIDGDTASSSEFLAAALRDHGRARFLGERTYGKGRIQEMFELGEGQGGPVLTTSRYVRPAGIAADRHDPPPAGASAGVFPDADLEMRLEGEALASWRKGFELRASPCPFTREEFAAAGPDPLLDRAVELLVEAVLVEAVPGTESGGSVH